MEDYFKKAYDKFIKEEGVDFQIDMTIEEMGELIKALSKYRRKNKFSANPYPKDNVLEELADVDNMIQILKTIFGREQVEEIKKQKVERTLKLFK